jgi:hypothetical protein
MACPQSNSLISGCNFTQFLVDQQPVYDQLILEDIRPEDGWILHVDQGTFEAYSGVQHTLDRFNHVWPNVTKTWSATIAGNCLGRNPAGLLPGGAVLGHALALLRPGDAHHPRAGAFPADHHGHPQTGDERDLEQLSPH